MAASGSTPNVECRRGLGGEGGIGSRRESIAGAVAAWAPGGLDYLMGAVGVSTLPDGLDLVRPGGTVGRISRLLH